MVAKINIVRARGARTMFIFASICPLAACWVAATAALVIVDDRPSTIQLKVTAGQQHIPEHMPGALYPGFGARKGDPKPFGELPLV